MASRQDPFFLLLIYILVSIAEAKQHSIKKDKPHHRGSYGKHSYAGHVTDSCHQYTSLERHFQGVFTPIYIKNSAVHP